jgi:hypothetical protein
LELARNTLRGWDLTRVATMTAGVLLALAGGPALGVAALLVVGELVARWLFYVTVVPLDVPGTFWRSTGSGRG